MQYFYQQASTKVNMHAHIQYTDPYMITRLSCRQAILIKIHFLTTFESIAT